MEGLLGESEKPHCYADVLPDELWLSIFKHFHPVYEDLFALSRVCKQWRRLITVNPDPFLWEQIVVANIRTCPADSSLLLRFRILLSRFGRYIKYLQVQKCHKLFADAVLRYAPDLSSLQYFEITGTAWDKHLLGHLKCFKSLTTVILEAAKLLGDEQLLEEDLCILTDNFVHLKTLGLQYSTVKSDTLNAIQGLVASRHSKQITNLQMERARMGALDIDGIVKNLPCLRKFTYGNDQIYGLPSFQHLILNSKSLVEVELFQISDFAQLHFSLPSMRKLTVNMSTSVSNLCVTASALRVLHLSHCVELRKLKRISANSLKELKLRKCNVLNLAEFISFLVRNPDIKTLELEARWANLRLDQHSSPSLEKLFIFDSGEMLMVIDVRCPKLQSFHFRKSVFRSTVLKAVMVLAEVVSDISIHDVPHLRRANIDVEEVRHLEIDFDRRAGQVKPAGFTKLNFRSTDVKIGKLVLKSCNIISVMLSDCKTRHVVLENCNLDSPVSNLLNQCGKPQTLTLYKCYGPCQLNVSNQYLKEIHIKSCSPLLMEHINLSCPSIKLLKVSGCSFLPNVNELGVLADNFRQLCPLLQSVNFSQ